MDSRRMKTSSYSTTHVSVLKRKCTGDAERKLICMEMEKKKKREMQGIESKSKKGEKKRACQ